MNHVSYHGTNADSAQKIAGPPPNIGIELGRGELGKGFYTGNSPAIASSWAHTKYPETAYIIEIEIEMEEFVKLKPHLIKTDAEVRTIWEDLKLRKLTRSFVFNCDYVIAPFATIREHGGQFKFESKRSEELLNKSKIKCMSCV